MGKVECLDCFMISEPDEHGRCAGCGSQAVHDAHHWPNNVNPTTREIVPDWEEAEYE